MTREDWLSLRDNIRQRLEDFADQFRRVALDELRGTPWLFWIVVGLACLPVVALLWWLL